MLKDVLLDSEVLVVETKCRVGSGDCDLPKISEWPAYHLVYPDID